jgi:hypothetical protein
MIEATKDKVSVEGTGLELLADIMHITASVYETLSEDLGEERAATDINLAVKFGMILGETKKEREEEHGEGREEHPRA